MSYHNKSSCAPMLNASKLISNDILIDMMMHKEILHNIWSINATPFFLTNENDEMKFAISNDVA